jgi:endogenous inhibitor of DNA gyrase (YacG/DUF329 family)
MGEPAVVRGQALPTRLQFLMRCPICKKLVNEPPAGQPLGPFPFCSDRCKMIDLGRWLDGKYQVPIAIAEDEDEAGDERTR